MLGKVPKLKSKMKKLDDKMRENNEQVGNPDQGDPKGGLTLAKLFKNRKLMSEWKKYNKARKRVEKRNVLLKKDLKREKAAIEEFKNAIDKSQNKLKKKINDVENRN